MGHTVHTVVLKPETLSAFEEHIRNAEIEMALTRDAADRFLWSDQDQKRAADVGAGQVATARWSGRKAIAVPDGLIHDWVGAAFAPGAALRPVVDKLQDYDNHKSVFRPEVVESRLLGRTGDVFEIYLRLLKKKVLTVVLDTYHTAQYVSPGPSQWLIDSCTNRVSEVEHAGHPDECARPADQGYGFLWRLSSYWRLLERDAGVYIQCRAISLTRDIPKGLGWAIEPIVRKLPPESLTSTLKAIRKAVLPEGATVR